MGNKTDVNGYVCPVAIVGIMGASGGNATCTIRNMFAFNNQYGANQIANNNSNGTWAEDTANDVYSDAAHASLYLQDTTTTFMPRANSYLNTNGVAMSTPHPARPDLWGFPGSTNRIGAIFYNSGGHSVSANAGSNQTITLPTNTVTLNGSASSVVNSTISSYSWSELSGPNTANLSAATSVSTTAGGLISGSYVFSLKVKDANNDSSKATVTITVNASQPPTVSAGANQNITLPTNSVALTGTATDVLGISSYLWTQVLGPNTATIIASNAISTPATGLIAGTYVFQLKVVDVANLSSVATVTITVNPANQPPTVSAGANQTITLPTNSVTLTGTATDVLGIGSYLWAQVSGPSTATIVTSNAISTPATGLIAGTYVFQLKVVDIANLSSVATVTITVNPANQPPVVSAGTAQTITLPVSSVTLTGTAADASGTISSYLWTQVSGPNTGAITNATSITTTVTGLIAGTYVFQLKATDNNNLSGTGTVTITLNPAVANQPPVANAGASQTITLPINSASLNGTQSSDPNGTITSYVWTEISGPSTATITGASTATPTVSSLIAGTYIFQLLVTDNNGLTGTAQVNIIVNPISNQPPVANAGANQTITLPVNSVALDGSASKDSGGTIVSFKWAQTSGPSQATIATSTSVTTVVNNLVQGTYTFKLTVTGNNGLTSSDAITITVNAAATQPPVANAGVDQTITLPTSTVNLDGSASYAPGGTIVSYNWTKASGAGAVTITNSNTVKPTVSGLQQGQYVFKLTVADNSGDSASAQVTVTVNPASVANQPPLASAGNDTTIALPASSIILNGSASTAPSGNITSYQWVQVSGPNSSVVASADSVTTNVNGLTAGAYVFQITVTDNHGATATDTVTVTVMNNLRTSIIQSITIYPNPTSSTLNLEITSETNGALWVYIYDIRGRIVMAEQYSKPSSYFSTPINLSRLYGGTYTLKAVIDKKVVLIAKFLKQ